MLSSSGVAYLPEVCDHDLIVDAIAADAFGPGRLARAAERVRELVPHDRTLSFVAILDDEIVGSIRQTPIAIGDRPCMMLGPLAVRPAYKGRGIGRHLMRLAGAAARARGESLIMLVGDRSYYEPLGYRPFPIGSVALPGPVDRDRILGLALVEGAFEGISGAVGRRRV